MDFWKVLGAQMYVNINYAHYAEHTFNIYMILGGIVAQKTV